MTGYGYPAEADVVFKEKVADAKRLGFEGWAIGGDEPPMADLAAKELNRPKRGEGAPDERIVEVGGLGEDQPEAIVFAMLWPIPKHKNDLVADVDAEAREDATDLWFERRQGLNHKRIRDGAFGLQRERID